MVNETKTKRELTNYGLGSAAGLLITWLVSLIPGLPDVPGEVGVAIGGICIWLAWRFELGRD